VGGDVLQEFACLLVDHHVVFEDCDHVFGNKVDALKNGWGGLLLGTRHRTATVKVERWRSGKDRLFASIWVNG